MSSKPLRKPTYLEEKTEEILGEGVPRLEVTNETLVNVYMSADQAIAGATWEILNFDSKKVDERGEFDTGTYQFTPDETGWYLVDVQARFEVGADLDRLDMQFYNSTDGTIVIYKRLVASSGVYQNVTASKIVKLSAGDAYLVRVMNLDSSDTISSYDEHTYLTIRRVFR